MSILGREAERDMVSPKTSPPAQGPTNRRDILQIWNFSMRSKGFVSHTRHLSSSDVHQWDETPKYLALQTSRVQVPENHRILGNGGYSSLKGLAYRFICPGTQFKSSSLKRTQTLREGIHLLILKHLPQDTLLNYQRVNNKIKGEIKNNTFS